MEVRRTHGGPAPVETGRALEEARTNLRADVAWVTGTRQAVASAEALAGLEDGLLTGSASLAHVAIAELEQMVGIPLRSAA